MAKRAGTRKRKIAILGTTPSRMSGPIHDDSWEKWTIGPGGADAHPWDRLYEVHGQYMGGIWPEEFRDYLNLLSKAEKPVHTIKPIPRLIERWRAEHNQSGDFDGDFSSNVVIDREGLFEKFGRMWFTSSISYCLADALIEGATDIGCWGIDLESGEEYIAQHPGARHFLDMARFVGINVHLPDGCGLMRDVSPYPDRYETHLAKTMENKTNWLNHIKAEKTKEISNMRSQIDRINGGLMIMRQVKDGKEVTPDDITKFERDLVTLDQQFRLAEAQQQRIEGELSATMYYRRTFVWGTEDPDHGNLA